MLSKVYHWGTDLGDPDGKTYGFAPEMHLEAIFNLVECGFAVSLIKNLLNVISFIKIWKNSR